MTNETIARVLTSPISRLCPANEDEKGVFADKKEGWFYSLGLASGQSFIVHLDKQKDNFTLRPVHNLLPHLTQIEWQKKHEFDDLGYNTICKTTPDASKEEIAAYETVLSPVPDTRSCFPATRIAFKYYRYPALLDRLIELRGAIETGEQLQRNLLNAQKKLQGLYVYNKDQQTCAGLQPNGSEGR